MKKAIVALALVCTPMVWAHGPGHYRPGENPHDPRHRAAAHDARPVPPPARPQAPGVRSPAPGMQPPAPGPQRPVPGVQRPQPPRPQAPAVHRPAPQGHQAPPSPKETTRPSRHQNVVPRFDGSSSDAGNANNGPTPAEPGLGGTGAVQEETTRRSRPSISSLGTKTGAEQEETTRRSRPSISSLGTKTGAEQEETTRRSRPSISSMHRPESQERSATPTEGGSHHTSLPSGTSRPSSAGRNKY